MSKVLLIDDDIELVGMFQEYLEQEGFDVKTAHDGEAGAAAALSGQYAIAILDVMMPRMNGLETLRRIRAHSQLPILMLTARGDDTDRIVGLELGADDYVAKPCTPRELTARIRAILRRTQGAPMDGGASSPLVVGQLTMWPEQRRATWAGDALELTSTEFNLLEVLARNAGKPVSKNILSEQGLGRPMARFDRNIDVHLSSLRHKLGTIADGRSCLQTVYRMGYQLIKE
ncbi:response regulator transcription factor [Pseudoduganella namucuonensis]|uniref:Two-component system, OmpR family, response regulator/two-component system, OmpR family, response regulator CpxR n=1 Tax=Pseudoduganella namucuonensis TaxID=1035707 RepID=A0A1I7HPB2_9BURK|nr:response regulator transcription factor [Pseudoduganella namucuonensis]SFU62547.1 two-component system, OmpR family, response regulator/two-component system, OmpR family, response regulator CpxR [Pseudoduganella namucuonensis]